MTSNIKIEELSQQVVAAISGVASLIVVIILSLKYLKLVKDRLFVHYVYMIAISDTMISFSYLLGYPSKSLCSMQGIISLFFERMSWFYTTIMVYEFYNVTIYKKTYIQIRYAHYFVWSINIILELLPLTTKTFYGGSSGEQKCSLTIGESSSREFYVWFLIQPISQLANFLITVWFTMAIIYYCKVKRKKLLEETLVVHPTFDRAWQTVILYPLAELLAWVPAQVYNSYILFYRYKHEFTDPRNATSITNSTHIIAPLYGFFLCIIFFKSNEEARIELKKMFYSYVDDDDQFKDEVRSSSTISAVEKIEL